MPVYVDDMRAKYGRMKMCHMIADEKEELHRMATMIGIGRCWYQGDHYDVCLSKRVYAVAAGAVEITWRQAGAMMYFKRWRMPMGDPATAVARMLEHKNAQKQD